jgi:transcriptional regulator with XRE-family HTH domain
MNKLFSERFRSARILNGFSLQDLADTLGNTISRQALHKYEKGEAIPDSEMIGLLSKALHVQPDFFFRNTKIALGNLAFRKRTKLPVKEQNKIVEHIKDVLARYLELEEILGIETNFDNPLKNFPVISSIEAIEEVALQVRKSWNVGSGPIYNTIELLEDNHIKVILVHSEDGFDSMQTWLNQTIPVIVINESKLKSPDSIRFTVLCELAHLLLPLGGLSNKLKERYCNQFAATMLTPVQYTGLEESNRFTQLLFRALAEEYISVSKAAVLNNQSLLDFHKQIAIVQ